MKKILLSGIKPTGLPHIGNYFGAMKQFVDLQDEYQTYVMIADYHTLTSVQDKQTMRDNVIGIMTDYLAIGLDPEKVTFFQQSEIGEHTELAWIFETLTTMPYLMRAHAFKDAEAKNKEINVGTFNYPMLMAADILLYDADIVPVGQDQKQHVEIARDTAEKFNRIYKEDIFKLPKEKIVEGVAVVPGIDGQKMSKSYNNTISLFASDEEIKKQVMAIVTDSGTDIPKNVYAIHSLIKDTKELDVFYVENKGKYKVLKEALIEDLIAFIKPMREKRKEFENDLPKVLEIIKKGNLEVKKLASKKMEKVREAIGVAL